MFGAILLVAKSLRKVPRRIALLRFVSVLMMRVRISILSDRSASDSGGDIVGKVYRAKCNGDISGQFGDGKFFVTAANGIGLPILALVFCTISFKTRARQRFPPPLTQFRCPALLLLLPLLARPAGGIVHLTFLGNTTTGIAYNAAASAVKSALWRFDDHYTASDWDVTGDAGGPLHDCQDAVRWFVCHGRWRWPDWWYQPCRYRELVSGTTQFNRFRKRNVNVLPRSGTC